MSTKIYVYFKKKEKKRNSKVFYNTYFLSTILCYVYFIYVYLYIYNIIYHNLFIFKIFFLNFTNFLYSTLCVIKKFHYFISLCS